MHGLVDCNNFYASCEALFQPNLSKKPIVVLSNNDGCVIARSNEAKTLGIKMGEPFFKIKHMCITHELSVFSSNYALYADISHRVMIVLQEYWPNVEIYSIDEAFLDLKALPNNCMNEFCLELQKKVLKHTGIAVSIGIGQTKTLAKLANKIAKTQLDTSVYILNTNDSWLMKTNVKDVWGIGESSTKKLSELNIFTAKHLQEADLMVFKNKLNTVLLRTALELRGISCINLNINEEKKSIVSSKSFGCMQTEKRTIHQALSAYCECASKKLRQQKSVTGFIQVFLCTNKFKSDLPQYSSSVGFKLITPTDDTRKIICHAQRCLDNLFKKGFHYKKVGIMLSDLSAKKQKQLSLFSDETEHALRLSNKLMAVMDSINKRYGTGCLTLGSNNDEASWKMKSNFKSPSYTTRWEDLPRVK